MYRHQDLLRQFTRADSILQDDLFEMKRKDLLNLIINLKKLMLVDF